MKLPDTINVTDHTIDISNFSPRWKKSVKDIPQRILEKYHKSGKGRYIVVLGGPSGSGKSTIAARLKYILENSQDEIEILNIGQDAYHYPQGYLNTIKDDQGAILAGHKGRFDTFDAQKMKNNIQKFTTGEHISFPLNALVKYYDYSIFVSGSKDFLRENIIT